MEDDGVVVIRSTTTKTLTPLHLLWLLVVGVVVILVVVVVVVFRRGKLEKRTSKIAPEAAEVTEVAPRGGGGGGGEGEVMGDDPDVSTSLKTTKMKMKMVALLCNASDANLEVIKSSVLFCDSCFYFRVDVSMCSICSCCVGPYIDGWMG